MTWRNRTRNRPEPFSRCMWDRVCPLGHPVHTGSAWATLALTGGQRLVFAIVGLVFVVWFVVKPVVFPHSRPKDLDREDSQRRLMREMRKHRD